MQTPDPKSYKDGVQYFHDTHKAVLFNCDELERLLRDAESRGVFASFAAEPGWDDVFRFFTKDAPQHERDEERLLFPMLAGRVAHIGFQPAEAPIHFLVEGHEIMQRRMIELVKAWEAYLKAPHDAASLAASHEKHAEEDAAFIAVGRELAQLYREHVTVEEQKIYSVADRELTGTEKLRLADLLRDQADNEAVTPYLAFERPRFSDPRYNVGGIVVDLQSDTAVGGDEEEEDEDAYEEDDVAHER